MFHWQRLFRQPRVILDGFPAPLPPVTPALHGGGFAMMMGGWITQSPEPSSLSMFKLGLAAIPGTSDVSIWSFVTGMAVVMLLRRRRC